ncbi:MAG: ATP-binding protein [Sphingomonadaceae bacterium]|nr:ATP-binding protein [Sphingomonadaceae bacterium]
MRIESCEVVGLFGNKQTIQTKFSHDLNILTGRNGAGKTSLLKLMWYIVSGNILLALKEIEFSRATVKTDHYECTVIRISHNTCKIEMTVGSEKFYFEDTRDEDENYLTNAEDEANSILQGIGSSVFFPTFRRIEGGFSLSTNLSQINNPFLNPRSLRPKNDIEEGLSALSKKLSNLEHIFVSAMSTADIVGMLLRKYTDLSELYNDLQSAISQEVISTIKQYKSDKNDIKEIDTANSVLDAIRAKIESMEVERESIMTPITAVQGLVGKLFKHSGIKISNRLSFGDAASAVNSDLLSAGEKQMLSFICYNAFYKNSVVFIDEPELSLHVDWQRELFKILLEQQSSNQFIIATHSPFIYSRYPDREIMIDSDRGATGIGTYAA